MFQPMIDSVYIFHIVRTFLRFVSRYCEPICNLQCMKKLEAGFEKSVCHDNKNRLMMPDDCIYTAQQDMPISSFLSFGHRKDSHQQFRDLSESAR